MKSSVFGKLPRSFRYLAKFENFRSRSPPCFCGIEVQKIRGHCFSVPPAGKWQSRDTSLLLLALPLSSPFPEVSAHHPPLTLTLSCFPSKCPSPQIFAEPSQPPHNTSRGQCQLQAMSKAHYHLSLGHFSCSKSKGMAACQHLICEGLCSPGRTHKYS